MRDEDKTKEELITELQQLREKTLGLQKQKAVSTEKANPGNTFQELHDLFDNANDLIQSVNSYGEFLYVNKKWRETLGYLTEEVEKLDIFDIIHPDSQEHCRDTFQKIMSGERIDIIEADFISKDGKRISVEGNVNCRFENGKPIATRAIFRDVTDKKRKEAAEIIKGGSELLKVAELIQICNFFVPDEAVVIVTNPEGKTGQIFIAAGKILHAHTGSVNGRKALFRMLGWEAGVYTINHRKLSKDATIDETLEKCLLDGARELDEYNNLKKGIEKAGETLEIQYSDDLMKRNYDPVTAEVLALAIKHKEIELILDKCKHTDLETMKGIIGLLQKGILRAT